MKKYLAILALAGISLYFAGTSSAATDVSTHATLPTSLVSYWSLEETSGTRVDTPGANDLTDVNTVLYGTGKQGNAADFETTNTEYLEIADASQSGLDLNGTDFSFNFWMNPETYQNSYMIAKWNHSTQNQYMFYMADATSFDFYTDNACSGFTYSGMNKAHGLSGSVWSMVTLVFDSSAASSTIYVNGVSIGTGTSMQTPTNCTSSFRLGDRTSTGEEYDGLMDEVGIWSKELTISEITDLYNGGAGLPYTAPAGSAPRIDSGAVIFE